MTKEVIYAVVFVGIMWTMAVVALVAGSPGAINAVVGIGFIAVPLKNVVVFDYLTSRR